MKAQFQKKMQQIHIKIFVVYLVALVIFLGVSILANYVIKEQVALQVSTLIRRMIKTNDYREVVYTLGSANLSHFDAVVFKTQDNNRVFSIPANITSNFLNEHDFKNSLLNFYLPVDIFADENRTHYLGTILFVYNRFSYCVFGIGAWLFLAFLSLPLISSYRKKVLKTFEEEVAIQQELSKAEIARKVRHDIRSPLASLQGLLVKEDFNLSDKKNLSLTINRIQDIVSELEEEKNANLNLSLTQLSTENLVDVLKEIIDEKKVIINEKIELTFSFENEKSFFSKVKRSDLKRVVSNVLNNSVESISKSGKINVSLGQTQGCNIITIHDSGCGISPDHLKMVTNKGFTFNKDAGSGLGLYYAKKSIEEHQGSLEINSDLTKGTTIKIELPMAQTPIWYRNQITLKQNSTVVVLDDQPINFYVWETQLSTWLNKNDLSLKKMSTSQELKEWVIKNPDQESFYLIDYDLGVNQENGLYLIDLLNLSHKSILVTGHFDDLQVQRGCEKLGCGLLSKGSVPVIIVIGS